MLIMDNEIFDNTPTMKIEVPYPGSIVTNTGLHVKDWGVITFEEPISDKKVWEIATQIRKGGLIVEVTKPIKVDG